MKRANLSVCFRAFGKEDFPIQDSTQRMYNLEDGQSTNVEWLEIYRFSDGRRLAVTDVYRDESYADYCRVEEYFDQ